MWIWQFDFSRAGPWGIPFHHQFNNKAYWRLAKGVKMRQQQWADTIGRLFSLRHHVRAQMAEGYEYNDQNCHSQQKCFMYFFWVKGTKTHMPVHAYELGQLVPWGFYLQFHTYPYVLIIPSNWLILKFMNFKFPFSSQDYSYANLLHFSICFVSLTWLLTSLPLIIKYSVIPLNSNIFIHLFFHSISILGHWVYIMIEEIMKNITWIVSSKYLDISILTVLIGVRR